MPLSRAPKCPQCGSREGVRKILYGMPIEWPDESKYAIGGCCITGDGWDPVWTCNECDHSWGGRQAEFSVETPIGQLSWSGELTDATPIVFANGTILPWSSIVSLTNGECLECTAGVQGPLEH